jgi:tryptophan halogenase
LQHKLDLWRSQGRFFRNDDELFTIPSWVQVLIGQRVLPSDCHGVAKLLGKPDVEDYLSRINGFLNKAVEQMPTHREFIDRSCRMREAG